MSQSMTREAALRIGLAARELDGVAVADLVPALAGRLGLPLTETKLAGVTVTDLREILAGEHADENCHVAVAHDALKRAVRLLWGEGISGSDLPPLDPYAEGDMPGSIRVACASNNGEELDGHFGSCERFLIYQVSPAESRLLAVRPTLEADHAEDRNASRATLIADCQVVYVQSIGGPAAAKVVRAGAHPVKVPRPAPAQVNPGPPAGHAESAAPLARQGHGRQSGVAGKVRRTCGGMMIEEPLLTRVMDQVASQASELGDALVTSLRKAFPDIHFSVCSDDDMPPRLSPAAGNAFCRLYYVDSADHCLRLTTDAETATGLVVALRDWDAA